MTQNHKTYVVLAIGLFTLAGCTAAIKREDILFKAQKIKAAEAIKTVQVTVAEHPEQSPVPPPVIEPSIPVTEPVSLPLPDISPAQKRLAVPEKLTYKSKFLGISIGEFVLINQGLVTLNDKPAYCFEITVKTLPFFAVLFKTKERYVSYIDPQRFVVLRHEEYIKGGILLTVTEFDHTAHTATYKNLVDLKEKTVPIPEKITDVIGGAFYLRTIPWQVGDTHDAQLYADEKIYDLVGLVESKTKTNGREATVFRPYIFLNGKPITKISAEVYFSTTEDKIPLRATLKTPLGSVTVVLTETEPDEKTK